MQTNNVLKLFSKPYVNILKFEKNYNYISKSCCLHTTPKKMRLRRVWHPNIEKYFVQYEIAERFFFFFIQNAQSLHYCAFSCLQITLKNEMNTILRTQNKNLIFFASKNIKHRYSIHFEFSPSITFYNNDVRFNHENICIIKHKQMSFRIGNMYVKYFYNYSIPREGNYLRVNRVILNITKGKRITINNEVKRFAQFPTT